MNKARWIPFSQKILLKTLQLKKNCGHMLITKLF